MATTNRASLVTKIHKELKKHYNYAASKQDDTVVGEMLLACCLENAAFQTATTVLNDVRENFFDLNEMRVSSVRELAEVLHRLSDPLAAATRLKRVLQHVFESVYSFDLEFLKKQKLGAAEKQLTKIDGTTPFVVDYVVQSALGGHAIPVDDATRELLRVLGVISDAECAAGKTPGLTRAIAKNKGREFGFLLHELAVDFAQTPHSSSIRGILVSINPESKERFPKRGAKKAEVEAESKAAEKKPAKATAKTGRQAAKKSSDEKKPTKKAKAKPKQTVTKKAAPKKTKKKKKAVARTATKKRGTAGARTKTGKALSKKKPR